MRGLKETPSPWTNKRVWKRLDRVLYSKEWVETFNTTRVLHLPRRLSDHHLLFIDAAQTENKRPSSFRFQNMWLKHHKFFETVRQSWNLPIEGYATEAEKIFDKDPSEANLIALNKSNAILVHALSLESEYWKQNNNYKWLEAGERNTKYFHALVKKQMLMSSIHRIIEGNREVTNLEQIRDSAAHYFENLLTYNSPRNDLLEFPFHFSTLSEEVTHSICNIPTEEETKE
ncbi:UNVERIFIED_CONTAM: hypothetical protein Sangu_2905300 [Sesamum angustifolium]|uniref:Reverse transcriptase n=1 Tax=Sesamum angustifolium TaxID=2727405 RepID=A0AAW2IM02_9LAMI